MLGKLGLEELYEEEYDEGEVISRYTLLNKKGLIRASIGTILTDYKYVKLFEKSPTMLKMFIENTILMEKYYWEEEFAGGFLFRSLLEKQIQLIEEITNLSWEEIKRSHNE